MNLKHVAFSLLIFLGVPAAAAGAVRVEATRPGGPSPLRAGDVLLVARPTVSGLTERLDSVSWRLLQVEVLPLQAVMIEGRRDGQPFEVRLDEGFGEADVVDVPGSAATTRLATAWTSLKPALDARRLDELPAAVQSGADALEAPADRARLAFLAADEAARLGGVEAAAAIVVRELESPRSTGLLRVFGLRLAARLGTPGSKGEDRLARLQEARGTVEAVAPESLARAQVLVEQARLFRELRRSEDAAAALDAASETIAARCDACRLEATWEIETGLLKHLQGLSEEAVPHLARGIDRLNAIDAAPSDVAPAELRLATLLRSVGRNKDARAAIDRVFALQDRYPVPDRERARALRERGTIAWFQEDYGRAEADLRAALALFEKLDPGSEDSARTLNNLGSMAGDQGRYSMARIELEETVSRWQRLGTNPSEHARALYNLGAVHEELGEFATGVETLQSALRVLEGSADTRLLGAIHSSLAFQLAGAGRQEEARAAFAESGRLLASLPEECYCAAPPARNEGWFEYSLGNHAEAAEAFRKALGLFERHEGSSLDLAEGSLGLGLALLATGRHDDASAELEKARHAYRAASTDSYYLGVTLHALGQVAAVRGAAQEAGRLYCEAVETLDRSSELAGGNAISRSVFRSRFSDIYGDCLRYRLQSGDARSAFATLESYRSRGLLEALSMRAPDWERLDPGAASARLRSLLAERAALAAQVLPGSGTREAEVGEKLLALRTQIEQELERLRLVAPSVAMLLRPRTYPTAELQAALGPQDVLASFVVFDDETLVFRVTRDAIVAHRVAWGRAELQRRVDAVRRQVAMISPAGDADLRSMAAELYAALIAPLGIAPDEQGLLLLSADGPLHGLPFALLWNERRGAYLVEERALKNVDSLTIGLQRARLPRQEARGLLAIADPAAPDASTQVAAWTAEVRALPPLPGARREVEDIARVITDPVTTLSGADATEERTTRLAQHAARVHFATHGVFDARRPLDSMLVLGPGAGNAGPDRDGLLHVWEIFERFETTANVVVLSACETGLGEDLSSEGMLGFARAFQHAGAGAVVASLWRIHDEATPDFMREFHHQLPKGDAVALRAAALSLIHGDAVVQRREQRGVGGLAPRDAAGMPLRHPYFWAGFQLFGDAR